MGVVPPCHTALYVPAVTTKSMSLLTSVRGLFWLTMANRPGGLLAAIRRRSMWASSCSTTIHIGWFVVMTSIRIWLLFCIVPRKLFVSVLGGRAWLIGQLPFPSSLISMSCFWRDVVIRCMCGCLSEKVRGTTWSCRGGTPLLALFPQCETVNRCNFRCLPLGFLLFGFCSSSIVLWNFITKSWFMAELGRSVTSFGATPQCFTGKQGNLAR